MSNGKKAITSTQNGVMQVDDEDVEEIDITYLEPVAYARNGKAKWKDSGRTMNMAVSPAGGEIATWITQKVSSANDVSFTAHPSPRQIPTKQQQSNRQH